MGKITICKDFTDTPGGRYITEGDFSGELFRDKILYPKLQETKGEKLIVDFDGCYGFGTSFLEEAFGGIVRKYNIKGLLDILTIISKEDESIPGLVKKYIQDAEGKSQ